jgi:opacity protein-like surface antigen
VRYSCNRISLLSAFVATSSFVLFLMQSEAHAQAGGPAAAWSNCYLGGQVGVATSNSHWKYTDSNFYDTTGNTDPQIIPGATFDQTRGIVGLQGGCNRAIGNWWLVGAEGAWITNPMNKYQSNSGFFPDPTAPNKEVITTNIQSIFSATGRIGFAPSTDWLLYGKGGYALALIETAGSVTPALSVSNLDFSTTAWQSGWTAGAGVEYRLFRNITLGLEYDYYRFYGMQHAGTVSAVDMIPGGTRPASQILHNVDAEVQTLMARINVGLYPAGSTTDVASANGTSALPTGNFSGFVTTQLQGASWTGTRGANVFAPDAGKGYQFYSPTTIGVDYQVPSAYKLETRIRSGYVYTQQGTAGQTDNYSGPIDTQAAFNLTLLNFDSIRPLLGLNLNFPTGNTYLPNDQRFTRMDPDLVPVGSYGVGPNVNPTAGFVFGVDEHTAVSLSAGYLWQGDFVKEGINLGTDAANDIIPTTDLKQKISPGNTYTLNGNVSSTFDSLVLNESFAYMGDSQASLDGVLSGRAGAKFTANASASYNFSERTALATNVSWNFSEKNQIPNGIGGLVDEPNNSNSNLIIVSIDPSYLVTDRFKIAANYSFLYRDQNFYDQFQDQFIPAKNKHSVGGSGTYALTDATTVSLQGSHAWVSQADGPIIPATDKIPMLQPPALKYQVWAGTFTVTSRF